MKRNSDCPKHLRQYLCIHRSEVVNEMERLHAEFVAEGVVAFDDVSTATLECIEAIAHCELERAVGSDKLTRFKAELLDLASEVSEYQGQWHAPVAEAVRGGLRYSPLVHLVTSLLAVVFGAHFIHANLRLDRPDAITYINGYTLAFLLNAGGVNTLIQIFWKARIMSVVGSDAKKWRALAGAAAGLFVLMQAVFGFESVAFEGSNVGLPPWMQMFVAVGCSVVAAVLLVGMSTAVSNSPLKSALLQAAVEDMKLLRSEQRMVRSLIDDLVKFIRKRKRQVDYLRRQFCKGF
jgi:hypothetical protein